MTNYPYKKVDIKFKDDISNLINNIEQHDVLNNSFYKKWMKYKLNLNQFEIFAINYFARVSKTPDRLSAIFQSIDDYDSKQFIMHNLNDEMGHGHKPAVHVGLLYHWLDSLHKKLGGNGIKKILENNEPTLETKNALKLIKELSEKNAQSASGILLAQEATGLLQIEYLYEGFRNYKHYYEGTQFNDTAAYHHVHLGLVEKNHIDGAIIVASRNSQTQEQFDQMSLAYKTYLEQVAISWESVSQEIEKLA
jgi:pyrroloquinoline quinone (PQQ) biosynthesis protein C